MFHIDKNSEIYFYGYSEFEKTKIQYSHMMAEGYNVKGFIDQRAKELRREIPCWTMKEFIDKKNDNKKIIIIFLLQNGSQHEDIVSHLSSEGYEKILFLPFNIDTEGKRIMYQKYNSFLEEDYEMLFDIPEVSDMLRNKIRTRHLVRSGRQSVIYFVPTEMLYSENPCY